MDDNESIVLELISNIEKASPQAISFPGYMYSFVVDKLFPRLNGVEMLTWFVDDYSHQKQIEINDAIYSEVLNNVKVVLIK